jgi:hypothetical protein
MLEHEDGLLLSNFSIPLFRDANPLQIISPKRGNPTAIFQFTNIEDWRQYVRGLRPRSDIPEIFRRKHDHVLQILFLAWLDSTVIKLAELGALATLEAIIKGRYPKQKFKGLAHALEYLVKCAGVTDEALPIYQETGVHVVQNILGSIKACQDKDCKVQAAKVSGKNLKQCLKKLKGDDCKGKYVGSDPGLSEIRNRLAHGDPFESMPWAGLFEVVRDLIDFMYPPLPQKTST